MLCSMLWIVVVMLCCIWVGCGLVSVRWVMMNWVCVLLLVRNVLMVWMWFLRLVSCVLLLLVNCWWIVCNSVGKFR